MAVWYSQAGRQSVDDTGTPYARVGDIYIDVVTDADGMFEIDVTSLSVTVDSVLDAVGYVTGQTLDALTDVTTLMSVMIVEVTSTVVKGVVVLANNVTAGVGVLVKPVKRAGSGINAKVKLTVSRG